ncbi:MAG: tRNA pseudouridine(38-40) synthase TruA [Chloroflexi bacterium]|nr:tRNA pseudouridine(38-40) synthase TruA [Chloroflexota bacterium]
MRRYAAILAYDGTAYQGFQRQPEPTPTIQAVVEKAISRVTAQPTRIVAAGRTDTGVHASGQVIAFDVEWKHGNDELLRAINSQLGADIALREIWRQERFHPRFDALWRQYAYRIATPATRHPLLTRHVWQLIGESLDLERMNAAAAICLGEHDFAAFGRSPQEGSANTMRQIYLSRWETESGVFGKTLRYRIRGTAFLYHMVRRLVGVMAQVGQGLISPGEFEAILRSRDIARAKLLAPAKGLILEAVGYPQRQATEPTTRAEPLDKMAAGLEGRT